MSNIINYTRLTTSEKQSDRFLTCQVYEPLEIEQKELGNIYSHVEILNPWFPNSQIGQTIINTVIREYYRGTNTSLLVNFESAIKKANETLAQIAQSGETDWIGKLNSILILISDKDLHLSQTGTSQAYLYRATKINHITEGLSANDKPHPLKTFNNLISGTLQEDDRVIVANSAFYEIISASELKNIINSFPPAIAAMECAKILRKNRILNANAIFLQVTTKETLANLPPDQKIETIYLDQAGFSPLWTIRSIVSSHIIPGLKRTFGGLGRLLATGGKKLSPKIKRTWKVTGTWSKKALRRANNLGQKSLDKIEQNIKKQDTEIEYLDQNTIKQSQSAEDIKPDSKSYHDGSEPAGTRVNVGLHKIKNKTKKFFIRLGIHPKITSKWVLRVGLILIFISIITVISAVAVRLNSKKNQNISVNLQNLQSQFQDAKDAEVNDKSRAIQLFRSIISDSANLGRTKYADQAQNIAGNSRVEINKLTDTTELKAYSSAKIKGVTLATIGQEKNFATTSNSDIFTKIKSLNSFDNSGKLKIDPDLYGLIYLPENAEILAANKRSQGEILKSSNLNQSQTIKLPAASAVAEYLDNLYLLNNIKDQIYKITREGNAYGEPTNYLKSPTSVGSSVDLAIDGSVYTLERDGKIQRLSRGSVIETFTIELPFQDQIKSPQKIFTGIDSDSIFIVDAPDNLRIIEISKFGAFKKQYSLSGTNAKYNIYINPDTREIIAAGEDKALSFKI
ncbi:hypothetical protein COT77_02385 [Candidatus Berkelbacteria bacterium CG10_big_fil_rev_8_21_14_0_10_41_12]|uniref:PPM-type phosphatase domain-containing protein n=1 Tax=Candidatus Berkelbacteria bacterium CG10_big_fil_rev_8_21_14_0_10_41_12 TaxID=1974513 RepID=A0A2M6WWY2_9BACT|nr:MAG: hypothetical protein COT77_02385 [Candidatus Berkelbacteria bacterium CG10_big_fil_rev_8_21_14_0_10_41_12]